MSSLHAIDPCPEAFASIYTHCKHFSRHSVQLSMGPKTHFSIPLKKTAALGTPAQRGGRPSCTSESIPLRNASRSETSGTHHHSNKYAQQAEASGVSDDIVETYPLRFAEPQYASEDDDDDDDDGDVEPCDKVSNVSFIGSSNYMDYAHLLYDRHLWANGFINAHDILIYCSKMKGLQGHQYAQPVKMLWRSNASIALGITTFARLVPSPLTSVLHFIGCVDGQEHTLRQYPYIHWASSCVLGITANLVHTLRRYLFMSCLIWSA